MAYFLSYALGEATGRKRRGAADLEPAQFPESPQVDPDAVSHLGQTMVHEDAHSIHLKAVIALLPGCAGHSLRPAWPGSTAAAHGGQSDLGSSLLKPLARAGGYEEVHYFILRMMRRVFA